MATPLFLLVDYALGLQNNRLRISLEKMKYFTIGRPNVKFLIVTNKKMFFGAELYASNAYEKIQIKRFGGRSK